MHRDQRGGSRLFSPLSIAITLVLLGVLGVVLWRTGGVTFSPGRLQVQVGNALWLRLCQFVAQKFSKQIVVAVSRLGFKVPHT